MKIIVICVDRTRGDAPASGNTNAVQLFHRRRNDRDVQLTHYDPSVGTFSAAAAWTALAQRTSRFPGNAFAAGMRTNHEAYAYPKNHWELWDTVKAPGILARSMEWPFTRSLPNVEAGRHFVSIDNATCNIHRTASYSRLQGVSRWPVPSTARVHASVQQRMAKQPSHGSNRSPLNVWADAEWRNQPQAAFAAQASRSDG